MMAQPNRAAVLNRESVHGLQVAEAMENLAEAIRQRAQAQDGILNLLGVLRQSAIIEMDKAQAFRDAASLMQQQASITHRELAKLIDYMGTVSKKARRLRTMAGVDLDMEDVQALRDWKDQTAKIKENSGRVVDTLDGQISGLQDTRDRYTRAAKKLQEYEELTKDFPDPSNAIHATRVERVDK